MTKETIRTEIQHYLSQYQSSQQVTTRWKTPLVGFASAADPLFLKFKKVVAPTHLLPGDLLPDARTIIAFFMPFQESIVASNLPGRLASPEWAKAYVDTNELIQNLGQHLRRFLENYGHAAYATPATHNFDPKILLSDWSHRHIAFAAGLGRFGLNNMLITEKGCCGRIGSLITTLALKPDTRTDGEACLFKHNGSCRKCLSRCVSGALSSTEFKRHACYDILLENEQKHKAFGTTDVCGKCLVGLPCSNADPVKRMKESRGNN
ncbi:MAG: epoxyqueuosine reductase [Deltaproteobacteria bacterium]|nr:epoxyqueuosine reductase [Deltaproteobacteria bacterium]